VKLTMRRCKETTILPEADKSAMICQLFSFRRQSQWKQKMKNRSVKSATGITTLE